MLAEIHIHLLVCMFAGFTMPSSCEEGGHAPLVQGADPGNGSDNLYYYIYICIHTYIHIYMPYIRNTYIMCVCVCIYTHTHTYIYI